MALPCCVSRRETARVESITPAATGAPTGESAAGESARATSFDICTFSNSSAVSARPPSSYGWRSDGMELHFPCLAKVGPLDCARGRQGNNGYKTIEEFLPEAVE